MADNKRKNWEATVGSSEDDMGPVTKPRKDYQNELKDLYETGTSDKDIAAAKQEQKKQNDMLMKQGAAMGAPAKEEKKETPMDALGKAAKKFKKGGSVGSASKRADGCCVKGKTKGKMV